MRTISLSWKMPLRMTIILHIGTHKTGTTTIQRFADLNRKELRRRGLQP